MHFSLLPGTGGVDTAAEGGVFDISNTDRLGFSEVDLVQKVIDGVQLLIQMEKKLENEESIDDLIPKWMRFIEQISPVAVLHLRRGCVHLLCFNLSTYFILYQEVLFTEL